MERISYGQKWPMASSSEDTAVQGNCEVAGIHDERQPEPETANFNGLLLKVHAIKTVLDDFRLLLVNPLVAVLADDWLRCLVQMPLRIACICESGGRSI